MFAIGRHPNIKGLGLEKAGVALNPHNGGIAVDGFSRTSVPNIYAIGDVTHRINLTPVAIREGHAFADTCVRQAFGAGRSPSIPTAVFSQPEVGTVGIDRSRGVRAVQSRRYLQDRFPADQIDNVGSRHRVLMKLVVDATTDHVVGCHVVGDTAAEIVQAVAIAVKMKATKADFDATFALHPTAAEELVTMRNPTARYVREAAE